MFSCKVSPPDGDSTDANKLCISALSRSICSDDFAYKLPIHHDDGHFPTIRLRQSTHLTKCPAHSHINFCSDKSTQIQRYNKSDIQTCNYCDGQTSFEMLLKTQLAFLYTWFECKFKSEHAANSISQYFRLFSYPLWIPHTMPNLQKRTVAQNKSAEKCWCMQ